MGIIDLFYKAYDALYDTAMQYGDTSHMSNEDIKRASKLRASHRECAYCHKMFTVNSEDEHDSERIYCNSCANDSWKQEQERFRLQCFEHMNKRKVDINNLPPKLQTFYDSLDSNPLVQEQLNRLAALKNIFPDLKYIKVRPDSIIKYLDHKEVARDGTKLITSGLSYFLSDEPSNYYNSEVNISYEKQQVLAYYIINNCKAFNCTRILGLEEVHRLCPYTCLIWKEVWKEVNANFDSDSEKESFTYEEDYFSPVILIEPQA